MTKDNSSGLFTGTPVAFVFVLFQDTIKSNFRYNKTHCFFSGGCKNRVKYTVFWTFIEFFLYNWKQDCGIWKERKPSAVTIWKLVIWDFYSWWEPVKPHITVTKYFFPCWPSVVSKDFCSVRSDIPPLWSLMGIICKCNALQHTWMDKPSRKPESFWCESDGRSPGGLKTGSEIPLWPRLPPQIAIQILWKDCGFITWSPGEAAPTVKWTAHSWQAEERQTCIPAIVCRDVLARAKPRDHISLLSLGLLAQLQGSEAAITDVHSVAFVARMPPPDAFHTIKVSFIRRMLVIHLIFLMRNIFSSTWSHGPLLLKTNDELYAQQKEKYFKNIYFSG